MTIDGLEFLTTLDDLPTAARDQQIFEAIRDGHAPRMHWCPVTTEHAGMTATVFAASRVFRVGDTNPVIVNVSHLTAQRLVDHLRDDGTMSPEPVYEAVVGTARLSDLLWQQADVKLPPCTQPAAPSERLARGYSARMDDTGAMARHHQDVMAQLGAAGVDCDTTLVGPMGKDWTATNKLVGHETRSAEYGLQGVGHPYQGVTPGVRVYQPGPSRAHVASYKDYIMCPRAWRAKMLIGPAAVEHDINDVARDPEQCWLVSSEGVIRSLRHPAVPLDGAEDEPPVVQPALPLFHRTLRYRIPMMVGDDVRVMQQIISATADGIFGQQTMAATKKWQLSRGLVGDGVFGRRSRAKAMADLANIVTPDGTVPAELSLGDVAFVPATNYTHAGRSLKSIRLGIAHTMEAPEKPSMAEAIANWFGGRSGAPPRASAHACVDSDSIVECVKISDIAWGVGGGNRDGYQTEHAGYARQTPEDWADPYSEHMLWLSARWQRVMLVDSDVKLPVEKLSVDDVAGGVKRGFCGHIEVTKAFRKSTHVDPGKYFPWDKYLSMIEDAA